MNSGKAENCRTIRDRTGKPTVRENNVPKTWKDYLENNVLQIQKRELNSMYGFDGAQSVNYFGEQSVSRPEIEMSEKAKNSMAADSESSAMPEDWKPVVIVPSCK